jgi:hypothetical protein
MRETFNVEAFVNGVIAEPTMPQQEDPKDVRIRQLESEIRVLKIRLSDHGWEASARHAQATGGWQ